MSGPGRLKRHRLTDGTTEALSIAIAHTNQELKNIKGAMSNSSNPFTNGNGLLVQQIPFKQSLRRDPAEGVFVDVVVTGVTPDMEVARITVLRKTHNRIIGSETQAQAKTRIQRALQKFDFELTDTERSSGIMEREIGPFKFRHEKDTTDAEKDKNRFQLIKLVAETNFGRLKNPMEDPLSDTASVPIATFQVNMPGHTPDDQYYFDLTDTKGASLPAANLLCNVVDSTTDAADAKVTFTIKADATLNTVSFLDRGYTSAIAVIRKVGDTGEPIKIGGVLADPTVTSVDLQINLPLGKKYEWIKNILEEAGEKEVLTAASPVQFTAGSGQNYDNFATDANFKTTLSATPEDNRHAAITLTLQQPTFTASCTTGGYIYKKIEFQKQKADLTWRTFETVHTLDSAGGANITDSGGAAATDPFASGNIATFSVECNTKRNISSINFRALVYGIGKTSTGAIPIRTVTQGSSYSTTLSPPADPLAADVPAATNVPDDMTAEADARTEVLVYFDNTRTMTYAQSGADHAYIVLRKIGVGTAQDDPTVETRLPKIGGPIDPDTPPNSTFCTVTARGLKLGKRYRLARTILEREGTIVKNTDNTKFYDFTAGIPNNSITNITFPPPPVGLNFISNVPLDSRHDMIICRFIQPNPPVLLKSFELFQQGANDVDPTTGQPVWVSLRTIRLLDNQAYQTPGLITVWGKAQHKQAEVGVKYWFTLTAVGGATLNSSIYTTTTFIGDAPSIAPSAPANTTVTGITSAPGFVVNQPDTDSSSGLAEVTVRVPIDAANPTVTTASAANVTTVTAVFRQNGTTGNKIFFTGVPDPTATYVDIECKFHLGKKYDWVKNININGGGQISSSGSAVTFRAGVRSSNLAVLVPFTVDTANIAVQDPRHSYVPIIFTQPTAVPASDIYPAFVRKMLVYGKKPAAANYHVVGEVTLKDDEYYQTTGTKTVPFVIQHPKTADFYLYPVIIGENGTTFTGTYNAGSPYILKVNAADEGTPGFSRPKLGKAKWSNAGILKAKSNQPDLNFETHTTNRIRFEFQALYRGAGSRYYYWNPDDPTTTIFSPSALTQDNLTSMQDSVVAEFADIGKANHIMYDVTKTTYDYSVPAAPVVTYGDIPSVIADALNGQNDLVNFPNSTVGFNTLTGYLNITLYFYNETVPMIVTGNPTTQSYATTSFQIPWYRYKGLDSAAVVGT